MRIYAFPLFLYWFWIVIISCCCPSVNDTAFLVLFFLIFVISNEVSLFLLRFWIFLNNHSILMILPSPFLLLPPLPKRLILIHFPMMLNHRSRIIHNCFLFRPILHWSLVLRKRLIRAFSAISFQALNGARHKILQNTLSFRFVDDEGIVEELFCWGSLGRLVVEAFLNKIVELFWPFLWLGEGLWGVVLDGEHCADGVDVGVRRLALCQLNCCNPQRPDVCLVVVFTLGQNFWTHPKRTPNQRVLIRKSMHKFSRHPKIR